MLGLLAYWTAGAFAGGLVLQGLLNWLLFAPRDAKRLRDATPPAPETTYVMSRGHRLYVRTVRPRASNSNSDTQVQVQRYRIFIPNGMAATVAMIGKLQDKLAEAGFVSVSYDR